MTAIPCKRPKVTVAPVPATSTNGEPWTAQLVRCHVPKCGFRYKAAVISDATFQATNHRQGHRAAVPNARVERDIGYDVHCEPCGGHCRSFGTRVDAEAWLNHHLHVEHGLVIC